MLTEIRTRIAQQLNIPVDNITADSKLVDDLKADSLDIVELVTSLEEEYNIEISDEDIKNIRTVGDVVRFIAEPSRKISCPCFLSVFLRHPVSQADEYLPAKFDLRHKNRFYL